MGLGPEFHQSAPTPGGVKPDLIWVSTRAPGPAPREEFSMNDEQRKWVYYAIPVVVVIGLGAALYYGRTHRQPAEQPVAAAPPAPGRERAADQASDQR